MTALAAHFDSVFELNAGNVEREVRGRAFGPELGNLGLRHRVVAAVDLDQRKLGRVVAQPFLGLLHFG